MSNLDKGLKKCKTSNENRSPIFLFYYLFCFQQALFTIDFLITWINTMALLKVNEVQIKLRHF